MTVNRKNFQDVEGVIKLVNRNPQLRGFSLNLRTPYPPVEHLSLSPDKRGKVIKKVMQLKKIGHPVLNSESALKALMTGNYRRPIGIIQMVEQNQVFKCCWARGEEKVCERCGYGIIAELSQLLQLKPEAIIHALHLFTDHGWF